MDYRYTIEQIDTGAAEGYAHDLKGAWACIEDSGCDQDEFAILDNETGEYVPM